VTTIRVLTTECPYCERPIALLSWDWAFECRGCRRTTLITRRLRQKILDANPSPEERADGVRRCR